MQQQTPIEVGRSRVLHLEKYEHEKSRCEELESLIEELESLVAELRTQLDSQRVTVTKHKHYKPSDEDAKPRSQSASWPRAGQSSANGIQSS